jgi:predicted RNA-binding protein YlxR (DUF448 family)
MKDRVRYKRDTWWRRGLGYLTRSIVNFVTGFDTVFTLVKAPLVYIFAGIILAKNKLIMSPATNSSLFSKCNSMLRAALKPWAPGVIGIAALGSLFYMASALKEEYDKNVEEDLKLKELNRVEEEEEKITAHIQEQLNPCPFATPPLARLNNGALLKLYLRNYLLQLGLLHCHPSEVGWRAAMKRKNDRLPGQNGIERLIAATFPDLDQSDPYFALKLKLHLDQYPEVDVPDDFSKRLNQAFKFPYPLRTPKEPVSLEPPKKQKGWFRKIVSFGKAVLMVGQRGNTGVGVIAWSLLLAGLVSFGSPVALPFLLAGAGIGILSGLSSYFYRKFVEKPHKKNVDNLDANLKYHKTRYELLYKLHHVKDKTYKDSPLVYPRHCYTQPDSSPNTDNASESSSLLPQEESDLEKYVPEAVRKRMALHGILQTVMGFGTGMVIGISIVSVVGLSACITLPVIGTVLAANFFGAIFGPLIGTRMAVQFRKASLKASRDEIAQIIRVEKRKIQLTASLGTCVTRGLTKSPQALLFELIQNYILYSQQGLSKKSIHDDPTNVDRLVNKPEKILRFIEDASGYKRSLNADNSSNNEDHEFYQNLVLYLLKDVNTPPSAHQLVTTFKQHITGKTQTLIDTTGKTLDRGMTLTGLNRTFLRDWAPALAAATIAVPLGIMLFGSFAFVPLVLIGLTIAGLYYGSRILEGKKTQNIKDYNETELKLNLIERSTQLQNRVALVNKNDLEAVTAVTSEHPSQAVQLGNSQNKVSPLAVVSQNKENVAPQNKAKDSTTKESGVVPEPVKSHATRSTYVGPSRKHAVHAEKKRGVLSSLFKESSISPSEEIDEVDQNVAFQSNRLREEDVTNQLLEKAPTRLRHVPSTRDFLDLLQKRSRQHVGDFKMPRSKSQVPLNETPIAVTSP